MRLSLLWVTLALVLAGAAPLPKIPSAAKSATPEPAADLVFTPGEKTHVPDKNVGGTHEHIVYVPSDYSPQCKWPVIVYFYQPIRENEQPSTGPLPSLIGGKGFIVLGLQYAEPKVREIRKEYENLVRVLGNLEKHLSINRQWVFLAGWNMGSDTAISVGVFQPDLCAGWVFFEGGAPPKMNLSGKCVYIAVSEIRREQGEANLHRFINAGADARLDVGRGQQSADRKDNPDLSKWLLEHGPMQMAKSQVAAAKKLEGNKPGEALALYEAVTKMGDVGVPKADAEKALAKLKPPAEAMEKEAEDLLNRERYAEALPLLEKLAKTYATSAYGDRATRKLKELELTPDVKERIKLGEKQAAADRLEKKIVDAKAAGDYATVIKASREYAARYEDMPRAKEMKDQADTLEKNPEIQAKIKDREAKEKGPGLTGMAEGYIKNGNKDKAREKLQEIIDKYPGTEWEQKARKRLADIGN